VSALTKGINVQSFSKSNLMLTLVVCFVVIALFFIPEIIGIQRTFNGTPRAHNREVVREKLEPRDVAQPQVLPAVNEPSPLERVARLMDSGGSVPPKGAPVQGKGSIQDGGANVDPNLVAKCVASLSEPAEKKVQRSYSETPLTWEKIRAGDSQAYLRRAQKEALTLSRDLPSKKTQTKYALLTFSNAVNAVLSTPEQFSSADEAIGYIEAVDQSVTKSIFREGVERADYLRWQNISLGPDLEQSRVARTKAQYRMPFNPRTTLEFVRAFQPSNNPADPAYVEFRGFMIGKEIKRLELRVGKKALGDILLLPPDKETGRRYFSYALANARGVYTIIAHDSTGEKFTKSYEFYSRVSHVPRGDGGVFATPYNASEIGETDSRLDRMYLVSDSAGRGGASNSAFSTF
jgi:hypothetical protein